MFLTVGLSRQFLIYSNLFFGEKIVVKSVTQKAEFNLETDSKIDIASKILVRSNFNCEVINDEIIFVNGKKCQIVFGLENFKTDKRKKFDATIFKTQFTGMDAYSAHVKIQLWYNWSDQNRTFLQSPKTLLDFLKLK